MLLVEILLPLADDSGTPFPAEAYDRLAQRLTEHFGGVTSFARSPGDGRWKNRGGTQHDDIVVMEIMTARGPGRLGRALALTLDLNGSAAAPHTGLWFEQRDALPQRIIAAPRVGVGYAGPKWSRRKLRFLLQP